MAPATKNLDEGELQALVNQHAPLKVIAEHFSVSVATVKRRLKKTNLNYKKLNNAVSDEDLIKAMTTLKLKYPNFGYRQLHAALLDSGLHVYRDRVAKLMHLVDPQGVLHRTKGVLKLKRIKYKVPSCHHVWHADTNLKLGRYKIVVRGAVDGYSRCVVYLDCGLDNTGASNLESFVGAARRYGIPFKVRLDKGSENREIARFQLAARGVGTRSVITGSSVHNTRIERFWRDLRVGVLSTYQNLFSQLESEGKLDIEDPLALAVLHDVFLPIISTHLTKYMSIWNQHRIRTAFKNASPNLMLQMHPLPADKFKSVDDVTDVLGDDVTSQMATLFNDDNEGVMFSSVNVDQDLRAKLLCLKSQMPSTLTVTSDLKKAKKLYVWMNEAFHSFMTWTQGPADEQLI